ATHGLPGAELRRDTSLDAPDTAVGRDKVTPHSALPGARGAAPARLPGPRPDQPRAGPPAGGRAARRRGHRDRVLGPEPSHAGVPPRGRGDARAVPVRDVVSGIRRPG